MPLIYSNLAKEVLVVSRFIIATMSALSMRRLLTAPWRIRPMDTTAFDSAALVMSQRVTEYLRERKGERE